MTASKQGITGFQVLTFQVKKIKDGEKVRLVLEANVDDVGAGNFDKGDILKALLHHQTGDTEVGLSLFMEKSVDLEDL